MKTQSGNQVPLPGRQILRTFCVAAALALALTSTGCSWFRRDADKKAKVVDVTEMTTTTPTSETPRSVEPEGGLRPTGLAPADEFLSRIFFDFDKSDLRADQLASLQRNAEYLRTNTGRRVLVEGHCDERGTVEYNFALGERRANAVKDYLVGQGVDASRLQTLSKGEEEPAAAGTNEAAWAQNRRAQFKFILP